MPVEEIAALLAMRGIDSGIRKQAKAKVRSESILQWPKPVKAPRLPPLEQSAEIQKLRERFAETEARHDTVRS